MESSSRKIAGAGVLALTLGASRAEAAGFGNTRIGGEQGGPVATNPTAVYYNPGALGFTGGGGLGLYGTLAIRRATWTHTQPLIHASDPPDSQVGNSGRAVLLNVFGGPQLGATVRFGNLVVGAGFFSPFFGKASWDTNDTLPGALTKTYPLAAAGVQRWFQIDADLEVLYFSAAAAYRIGPLSVGLGGNLIFSDIVVDRAKTISNTLPDTEAVPGKGSIEGRARLDVTGFGGSFSAGAMLEILPDQLWLGASYQAQPGLGEQTLSGTLDVRSSVQGGFQLDVDFHQTLPDVIRGGIKWRPKNGRVEFRIFGDYTRWSVLTSQCIGVKGFPCRVRPNGSGVIEPGANNVSTVSQNILRQWQDTYGPRIGVSYWASPAVELQVGAGYETAAAPDTTLAPDAPDANNASATLGARFMLTPTLFFSASYTHTQFADRDTTGKSILQSFQPNTGQEDSGGRYTQWIGYAQGNLEALFP